MLRYPHPLHAACLISPYAAVLNAACSVRAAPHPRPAQKAFCAAAARRLQRLVPLAATLAATTSAAPPPAFRRPSPAATRHRCCRASLRPAAGARARTGLGCRQQCTWGQRLRQRQCRQRQRRRLRAAGLGAGLQHAIAADQRVGGPRAVRGGPRAPEKVIHSWMLMFSVVLFAIITERVLTGHCKVVSHCACLQQHERAACRASRQTGGDMNTPCPKWAVY